MSARICCWALHEESVVAIAHGYAKASGKAMAVVLHSNVGLMHGMMAVFNAWCDRVPILMLGATGAVDTAVGGETGSTGCTRRVTRARWSVIS